MVEPLYWNRTITAWTELFMAVAILIIYINLPFDLYSVFGGLLAGICIMYFIMDGYINKERKAFEPMAKHLLDENVRLIKEVNKYEKGVASRGVSNVSNKK